MTKHNKNWERQGDLGAAQGWAERREAQAFARAFVRSCLVLGLFLGVFGLAVRCDSSTGGAEHRQGSTELMWPAAGPGG
jgi:hypothetical protein